MSKIKEILCMPHSHLDIGYTHPQPMLMELQCDYIENAIDLCVKTIDYPEEAQFRWTCEATYPVLKWLKTAQQERIELFRNFVKEGRISITALPMHTTPGCTTLQMTQYLQQLDQIRELTGSEIKTAINHDVNGQPWTLSSLMLDSGVEFYLTGINIHYGGIPFQRPYAFRWGTPDGRALTSFVGENYNLFNELCQTSEESVEKIQEGILEYTKWIDEGGIWHEDYAFLTCTNPPQWDNNPPDAALPDLICQYNNAGYGYIIRFATPEMLYQRLQKQNIETLPTHSGDWTDYWNFGCASTAREVKISRKAKSLLLKNDFLECVNAKPSEKRFQKITEEAFKNSLIFEEHTWGASESISNPTGEHTLAQLNHKKEFAYNAADLSAYMVNYQLDRMANNPWQSKKYDGVLLVNPTGVTLQHQLNLPDHIAQDTPRKLKATRVKGLLPYDVISTVSYGTIEMPPFTAKRIPLAQLEAIHDKKAAGCQIDETKIETPFYCIELRPETKFIRQITEKATGHKLIHEESEWGFFDLIEENTDERYASPSRENLYRTDVMERYHGISNWNHDWKATRRGIDKLFDFHVEENGESITLCYRSESKTLKNIEQRITFSTVHKAISLDVTFDKTAVCDPEGIYFAFPLHLDADWECVYDTMDAFVKLDEQQLGAMCRDYLTIDKSISLFDKNFGYTLACPDAPMVQVGGFRFAKETRQVERNENPLLLAWPLNNYWCTNFAPSQDGKMSFHYELSTFETFDEKEAYRAGVQAAALCAVGEIVECPQAEENEFIHLESETSSILFIRPLYHEAGWLVAVKNFSAHEGNCKISIPGRQITFAAVTDIPGKVKEELKPIGNMITITQNPNAITFLKLQF